MWIDLQDFQEKRQVVHADSLRVSDLASFGLLLFDLVSLQCWGLPEDRKCPKNVNQKYRRHEAFELLGQTEKVKPTQC